MYHLGLTGYPLGHSISPRLHAAALRHYNLDGEYRLYPVDPGDDQALAALLGEVRSGKLDGLNVTIPHKQTVIPLLDGLSPLAAAIGAVNTITLAEGWLLGENTDAPGFLFDLERELKLGIPGKAVVMGAGGAARAVVHGLCSNDWQVVIAYRREDRAQALELAGSAGHAHAGTEVRTVLLEAGSLIVECVPGILIVNATPVGMSPNVDSTPWPSGLNFPEGASVYDVVYSPRETMLVKQARRVGLQAVTGLGMLIEQAALAFSLWTGKEPPGAVMRAAAEAE
ncbi:MAG: shikimate dehydrogenase [Anaerolineales bacterium]|nr:shikimate dehydrogenase [Anaerolineales bacterium]